MVYKTVLFPSKIQESLNVFSYFLVFHCVFIAVVGANGVKNPCINKSFLQSLSNTMHANGSSELSCHIYCCLLSSVLSDVVLNVASFFASLHSSGGSRAAATNWSAKWKNGTVNYYHKALHLGCCSRSRSASA